MPQRPQWRPLQRSRVSTTYEASAPWKARSRLYFFFAVVFPGVLAADFFSALGLEELAFFSPKAVPQLAEYLDELPERKVVIFFFD